MNTLLQGGAAWSARQPHNLKVAGSNPAPATTPCGGRFTRWVARCFAFWAGPTNRNGGASRRRDCWRAGLLSVRPVCNDELDEFIPLAPAGGLARLNPRLLRA